MDTLYKIFVTRNYRDECKIIFEALDACRRTNKEIATDFPRSKKWKNIDFTKCKEFDSFNESMRFSRHKISFSPSDIHHPYNRRVIVKPISDGVHTILDINMYGDNF